MLLVAALLAQVACRRSSETSGPVASSQPTAARPSILLVTLDTTRADSIGPEAAGLRTPAFDAVAARGVRFRHAYATVPETLPSHVSMMTGLYPAGHAIHENGRTLGASHPVVAELLQRAGYRTAAFVSSFTLVRRFGLARGFDLYDDALPTGQVERTAAETTAAATRYLDASGTEAGGAAKPLLLWVHYFDPHHPYTPPEPFARQFPGRPYLGEIAAMDEQLGRLVAAFERRVAGPRAIILAGDHGEGLGDHGEALHGNLLYQSTMHVPLVVVGPGLTAKTEDTPVSLRRIHHTILDWAGLGAQGSLRQPGPEVVLGEAMKPFLEYGWQPQIMTVRGRHKTILAGPVEMYDVVADPREVRNLADDPAIRALVPAALRDYPVPSPAAARAPEALDADARKSLASLGYVSAGAAPVVRKGAPRPADMTGLFEVIERASSLFVAQEYKKVTPLLQQILLKDPFNLDAALRLATAYSALGQNADALAMFKKAAAIAPESADVRAYLALHYARGPQWQQAVPLLEQALTESPDRLPVIEALSALRERQGRVEEAATLRRKAYELRQPDARELAALGELEMAANQTEAAIASFERARALNQAAFRHDLELGVLYLAARRFIQARDALDRVPSSHPEYPMALFKRAQVSVLLNEPDRAARIARARERADSMTRELIERERLFR